MSIPSMWTVLVKLQGLELRTARRHPAYAETFTAAANRVRQVIAQRGDRAAILHAVDVEQIRAAGDHDLARGAWVEEQFCTFKCSLLTREELEELQALADRIAANMAAAR